MHSDTDFTSLSIHKYVKKVNKPSPHNIIAVSAVDENSEHKSPLPILAWVKDVLNKISVLE